MPDCMARVHICAGWVTDALGACARRHGLACCPAFAIDFDNAEMETIAEVRDAGAALAAFVTPTLTDPAFTTRLGETG